MCDELEDLSALAPLENIETLKIGYCGKITTLKALGPKPRLETLELNQLPCTELEIVASFGALQSLKIESVENITSLPQGLSSLVGLTKVYIKDVGELKDISVLERCESLIDFECEGSMGGPGRKSIAKVDAAIAARTGNVPVLQTSYATFMKSMYKGMSGKEDPSQEFQFPLLFDTRELLLLGRRLSL